MKWTYFVAVVATLGLVSCSGNSNDDTALPAKDFVKKFQNMNGAQLLDVRSPHEFAGGHLRNAVNIDWNDPAFASKMQELEKSKPVFVYCLSGARSNSAVEFLKKEGFTKVYGLEGGMIKGGNELALLSEQSKTKGMTREQYNDRIKSEKIVLVDFYADWCAPCKQMEPYINRISATMQETVEVIRIDADQHPDLCASLGVDALPTIKIFKNDTLSWNQVGYASEAQLMQRLK